MGGEREHLLEQDVFHPRFTRREVYGSTVCQYFYISMYFNTTYIYCTLFHEQNDTRAVNRTCERFCTYDSHMCLSH